MRNILARSGVIREYFLMANLCPDMKEEAMSASSYKLLIVGICCVIGTFGTLLPADIAS